MFYRPSTDLKGIGYSYDDRDGDPLDRHYISGYCTFVGGNLVTCAARQSVISRSSADTEYWAMPQTACEMMCIQSILSKMGVSCLESMVMYCNISTLGSDVYCRQSRIP